MNALCVLGSLFLAAFGLVGLACYALGRLCGKSEAGRENGPNAEAHGRAVARTLDAVLGSESKGQGR